MRDPRKGDIDQKKKGDTNQKKSRSHGISQRTSQRRKQRSIKPHGLFILMWPFFVVLSCPSAYCTSLPMHATECAQDGASAFMHSDVTTQPLKAARVPTLFSHRVFEAEWLTS